MVVDYNDKVLMEARQNNADAALMEAPPENPFELAPSFRQMRAPDTPINYGGGLVEALLNNDEIPEELRKRYWFATHKDNVLTFLTEDSKASKLMNFDILKIDFLNAVPYYDYTFEMEKEFDMMRHIFELKADRSLGRKDKNERILLNSQFTEQKVISGNDGESHIKNGFFKRLLGRR